WTNKRTTRRFYADRTAGGHRDHRHPGGDLVAGAFARARGGEPSELPEQPQTVRHRIQDVLGREQGSVPAERARPVALRAGRQPGPEQGAFKPGWRSHVSGVSDGSDDLLLPVGYGQPPE